MTRRSNNEQRLRAFFPPNPRTTVRGKLLDYVLYLRCLRSWIGEGSYAWYRFSDDIKAVQRQLLAHRNRPTAP